MFAALAGAVTGSIAWFALKPLVDRQLKAQIRTELATQLPAQLRTQLDTKLASYGITPATGAQIARLLQLTAGSGAI